MQLAWQDNAYLDTADDITVSRAIPVSIQLVHRLQLSEQPIGIFHSRGYTFVATSCNTIVRIDRDKNITQILELEEDIIDFTVYEERLYIACSNRSGKQLMKIYDFDGAHIIDWYLSDEFPAVWLFHFTVVSNTIIVPNWNHNKLLFYSLTGLLVRDISFDMEPTHVCSLDDTIISCSKFSKKIQRMNTHTGQVAWTLRIDAEIMSITSYGDNYVLVAIQSSDGVCEVAFLNAVNGEI